MISHHRTDAKQLVLSHVKRGESKWCHPYGQCQDLKGNSSPYLVGTCWPLPLFPEMFHLASSACSWPGGSRSGHTQCAVLPDAKSPPSGFQGRKSVGTDWWTSIMQKFYTPRIATGYRLLLATSYWAKRLGCQIQIHQKVVHWTSTLVTSIFLAGTVQRIGVNPCVCP